MFFLLLAACALSVGASLGVHRMAQVRGMAVIGRIERNP
jgi:hypothetical protein